jgi:hypothetical protein
MTLVDPGALLKWLEMTTTAHAFLASPETLATFVTDWENGRATKQQWTHAAHVAVGAYYSVRFPESAFERMKNGLLVHNAANGTENTETSGYHETLTRLWISILTRTSAGLRDPWEAACLAVERFGENRTLHSAYYSFDVFNDKHARRNWIPPDVQGPY